MLVRVLAAALAATLLAGCASPADTASFANAALDAAGCVDASGVSTDATTFEYGGASSCKTAEEEHAWSNAAARARAEWGGAAVSGSLAGVVLDAAGREVFAFEIDATAAEGEVGVTEYGFPTVPPVLEPWTIRLTFRDFSGTMGLVLRSAT